MFDTKDNYNLSERHVYSIDLAKLGSNHWNILSPIIDDHRSVTVSQNRNLIAFPFSYWDSSKGQYIDKLVLFSYSKSSGFTLIGGIESTGNYGLTGFERSVYIGDYIYAVGQQKIISAKISKFEVMHDLRLS